MSARPLRPLSCPVDQSLNAYLRGIDEGYLKAEQAATLASDPDFIVDAFAGAEFYDAISGVANLPDLPFAEQIKRASTAHETLALYLAGQIDIAALQAALDACKPAFQAWLDVQADDEVNS